MGKHEQEKVKDINKQKMENSLKKKIGNFIINTMLIVFIGLVVVSSIKIIQWYQNSKQNQKENGKGMKKVRFSTVFAGVLMGLPMAASALWYLRRPGMKTTIFWMRLTGWGLVISWPGPAKLARWWSAFRIWQAAARRIQPRWTVQPR